MSKIEGMCREVIDKAEWIAIATSGAEGPHLAGTWGEYIRTLGVENDEILLVPVGGYRTTERNLASDNRIEIAVCYETSAGCSRPGEGMQDQRNRPDSDLRRTLHGSKEKIPLGQRSAGRKSPGSQ